MIEKCGFSLQKITITLSSLEELKDIETRIHSAKASYDWLYQNEKSHDVLVSVILPMYFNANPNSEGYRSD